MVFLYKFTKGISIAIGVSLIGFGSWVLIDTLVFGVANSLWLIAIFPIYIGAMLILVALAMREDWFTNARKYW